MLKVKALLLTLFVTGCSFDIDALINIGIGQTDAGPVDGGTADAGAPLRMVAVGDSITAGSPGNIGGYRAHLGVLLTEAEVAFEWFGRNTDDGGDHEGYSGLTVEEIETKAIEAVGLFSPDVVLIMGGTNNNPKVPEDYATACENIKAEGVAHVIAATIPPRGDGEAIQPTIDYNEGLPAAFFGASVGITLYPVSAELAYPGDMADVAHPNDTGYEKLAAGWYAGMQAAYVIP